MSTPRFYRWVSAAALQELDYPARIEAALGMDPTPEQARHLELHRRAALSALFETHPDLFRSCRTWRNAGPGSAPK
jgi:hypothetical protein